jgi:hypothetical protein
MTALRYTRKKTDRKTRVTMTPRLWNRGPTQSRSASLRSQRAALTRPSRNYHRLAQPCQRKIPSSALLNPYVQQFTSLYQQRPLPYRHPHSKSFSSHLQPFETRVRHQLSQAPVDRPAAASPSSLCRSAHRHFPLRLLYSTILSGRLLYHLAAQADGVARHSPKRTRLWLQDSSAPLKGPRQHVIASPT